MVLWSSVWEAKLQGHS
uniref:Uncharacterized protein n=1 Tax=Lepeophtheirus salmonis TaxID=72036 RepID=A0A0K2VKY0_LEPSM